MSDPPRGALNATADRLDRGRRTRLGAYTDWGETWNTETTA